MTYVVPVNLTLNAEINTNFSGTTAVISILIENNLFCANVGDSRAVLCSLT
jgi:serine/threonine protein phosphatase PrpC